MQRLPSGVLSLLTYDEVLPSLIGRRETFPLREFFGKVVSAHNVELDAVEQSALTDGLANVLAVPHAIPHLTDEF